MSEDKINNLEIWCKHQFQMDLSKQQIQQFQKYLSLLQEWNQKINLTAITKENEIIEKHFIDSLTCLTVPVFWLNIRVMDIGTGAGFPGIPLKIIRPDLKMTLVETVGKKAQFLEKVIHDLKLENVTVLKERAETLGHQPEHRESYDVVISRALAKLPVGAEFCLPFVRLFRVYMVMLGEDCKVQLESAKFAISELVGKIQSVNPLSVTRSIVIIEKMKPTPSKYPRKAGIPEKRLLKKK